ncbi:hypothetical protein [Bacillus velezensis]|uniref:hypothetical protein n=1 Tax=Bacillus velezensis TaxID=492670 RepID=UPI0027A171CC|nr:hypothetical protein [Bacillus velezensis]MEC2288564.1 hypothetical protein [Bacillus velezensis]MEC2422458.1 hypothetical protein [Bacillus velezensis]WFF76324.1 hypothetical protein P6282_21055 [Bacillus velezensis]WFF76400.1 hypothetical protein P6282_00440 [Bacillus velezensis]
MKEFKINLSKGEVLYTGSYICALSKTPASTPEQISLEAAAEKLAEELIMQQAMNREHLRQQEVTVIQFRQAQEEISRLTKENEELKLKVEGQEEEIRDLEFENSNLEDEIEELEDKVEALEGAAE